MMKNRFLALAAALLAPSLLQAIELPSSWRNADVTVDGVADEWSGHMLPIPGQPLSVGVLNDGGFVYICVKTSDDATKKKILGVGLSVYLDASGKEKEGFGIRFPVGRSRRDPLDLPPGDVDSTTAEKVSVAAAGRDLQVLGGEADDAGLMRVSDAKPIEAAVAEDESGLVVELKVPLAFTVTSPHAVETTPGATISLGLETTRPKMKREGGGESGRGGRGGFGMGGGGMRGGGGGGFGGMRGGGRGGRRGGGDGAGADEAKSYGKPLKLWLSVPLAKESAAR
jgi:hypothetical protein